jgi:hypothetical protein
MDWWRKMLDEGGWQIDLLDRYWGWNRAYPSDLGPLVYFASLRCEPADVAIAFTVSLVEMVFR